MTSNNANLPDVTVKASGRRRLPDWQVALISIGSAWAISALGIYFLFLFHFGLDLFHLPR